MQSPSHAATDVLQLPPARFPSRTEISSHPILASLLNWTARIASGSDHYTSAVGILRFIKKRGDEGSWRGHLIPTAGSGTPDKHLWDLFSSDGDHPASLSNGLAESNSWKAFLASNLQLHCCDLSPLQDTSS